MAETQHTNVIGPISSPGDILRAAAKVLDVAEMERLNRTGDQPRQCRFAQQCSEEGSCINECADRAPIAHLRSITHPDWLEICRKDEEGAFPVWAGYQTHTDSTDHNYSLKAIAHDVSIMLGSAQQHTDGEAVTGYTIKTGALHRIIGELQSAGYPVTVPAAPPAVPLQGQAPTNDSYIGTQGQAQGVDALEEAARICERLRDDHIAGTRSADNPGDWCAQDGDDCDFVCAWNDAAAAIREYAQRLAGQAQAAPAAQALTPAFPLPDGLFDSKDWKDADYAGRVAWLFTMYENVKAERDELLERIAGVAASTPPAPMTEDEVISLFDSNGIPVDPGAVFDIVALIERHHGIGTVGAPASGQAQERDALADLKGEANTLARILRDAYKVLLTVDGENADEEQMLNDLRTAIVYALDPYKREGTLL